MICRLALSVMRKCCLVLVFGLIFSLGIVSFSCAQQPLVFENQTQALGLELANAEACWVDVDNDGWVDLCAGGTLWKNNEGKNFTRLVDGLGAVSAADYDNDGFTDLFSRSALKLFHNNGDGTFTGVDLPGLPATNSRGSVFGDFNSDGFVDIYVGGFEDWDRGITYPSMILMNDTKGSFNLVWTDEQYRSRGITACDFDQDFDLDVYVSNYRLQPNRLMLNDGTGAFEDVAGTYNAIATSSEFGGGHSIGAAWGDFDNDGCFDLFAGNFAHVDNRGDQPKSRFLRNLGPEAGYRFEDLGTCGVFYQESYASPGAGDFDNDGDLDLFFTTVYGVASFGRPNNPVMYRNDGYYVFGDVTEATKLNGLEPTYQAAWADFDNDGDLDLVSAGKLFVNQGTQGHWLKVCLKGDGNIINRDAIGAQVRISVDDQVISRQVEAGTGEGNQNDLTLHFGLGDFNSPVNIEITWPNGASQVMKNIQVDQLVSVNYTK